MDAAIEVQLNNVKALKMSNSALEAQLSQLAGELQDKEKLVSCELCLSLFTWNTTTVFVQYLIYIIQRKRKICYRRPHIGIVRRLILFLLSVITY